MVAIADGKPMQLSLLELIRRYIAHQKNVVARRTKYDLDQAKAREHILEGLMIAVDNLDAVIALIRAAKNPKEAREGLMEKFALTQAQAQAILDMRLQRLTGLEILALRKEYAEVQRTVARLEGILHSEKKLLRVIREELSDIRDRYADPRRTELVQEESLPAQEEREEIPARSLLCPAHAPGLPQAPAAQVLRQEGGERGRARGSPLPQDGRQAPVLHQPGLLLHDLRGPDPRVPHEGPRHRPGRGCSRGWRRRSASCASCRGTLRARRCSSSRAPGSSSAPRARNTARARAAPPP